MDSDDQYNKKVEKMKNKIPLIFFEIPLTSLSSSTKEKLKFLDCTFILPGSNITFRDYRGLAVLQGYDTMEFNYLIDQKKYTSPTFLILDKMKENNKSVGDLIHCLQQLKRCDILARIKDDFNNDMQIYRKNTKDNYNREVFNDVITQHEVEEDKKSLEKIFTTDILFEVKKIEIYDVFISFNSESIDDIKVMWKLSELLEQQSVTVAKGSFSFAQGCCLHDAFAKAIYNRSRKVILLLSNSFINSESCVMQLNYAKDSDKASWKNKVIPVYIENIRKPESIANLNCFNYYNDYIREKFMGYFINSLKC